MMGIGIHFSSFLGSILIEERFFYGHFSYSPFDFSLLIFTKNKILKLTKIQLEERNMLLIYTILDFNKWVQLKVWRPYKIPIMVGN